VDIRTLILHIRVFYHICVAFLLLLRIQKYTFLLRVDFWFDEQFSKFSINYYYTGYYAVQINYLDSTNNFVSQELAVIPSSAISTLTTATLTVDDNESSSVFNFDISIAPASTEVLSINLLIYYDVEVPSLSRKVSSGFAMSMHGDILSASSSAKLSLHV